MRKKTIIAAAAGIVGIAALSGCSGEEYQGTGDFGSKPAMVDVKLDDGRTVPCLFIGKNQFKVMSCDWAAASR